MRVLGRASEGAEGRTACTPRPLEELSRGSRVGRTLEGFRTYLLMRARRQVAPQLQGKLDLSGAVQQTLLDAHQAGERLRTQNPHELAGWLRKVLRDHLADMLRWSCAAKRDVRRERSLFAAVGASPSGEETPRAADHSSPSGRLLREERLMEVAQAVQRLPEDQRRMLELHYREGLSLKESSERLGRSREAAAGLLYRGMKTLRSQLGTGV
jgi:RNA polymerase sigma-70 factor, ECF subfamily